MSDISTSRDNVQIIPKMYNKSNILWKLQEEVEFTNSQLNGERGQSESLPGPTSMKQKCVPRQQNVSKNKNVLACRAEIK